MFKKNKWLYIGVVNNRKFYTCPKCGMAFEVFAETKYCQRCGKRLENPLLTTETKTAKI